MPWRPRKTKRGPVPFSNAVVKHKQILNDGEGSPFRGSKPHDPEKYEEVSVGHFVMHTLEWADDSEPEPIETGTPEQVRIIPWSGGWDSTSYLFWYLKNTNYKIHAHHANVAQIKMEAERWAIKNMLPIAQSIRPFTFTESSRDERQCGFAGFAVQNAAYTGYLVAIGRYATCQDVEVCLGIYRGEMPPTAERMSKSRQYRAWLLFDALCAHLDPKTRPFISWKLCHMTKRQLALQIPEEARRFVWTCEGAKPVGDGFARCGACAKCVEERRLLADLVTQADQ